MTSLLSNSVNEVKAYFITSYIDLGSMLSAILDIGSLFIYLSCVFFLLHLSLGATGQGRMGWRVGEGFGVPLVRDS